MEKIYRTPDMEVTEFEMVDVITASNPELGGNDTWYDGPLE